MIAPINADSTTSALLEAALAFASAGIPVFPCKPKGKAPRVTHGFKEATTDPVQIQEWWELWPDANIGMPTGELSGRIVLDVDMDASKNKNGIHTLSLLERRNGKLPPTLIVQTPRGGMHHYFQYPGRKVPCSTDKLGSGLDVRGDGGYVIVPPSLVDKGRSYTHVDSTVPIAQAPEWLIDLMTDSKTSTPMPVPKLPPPATKASVEEVQSALDSLNPDCPYNDWIRVGMALQEWDTAGGLSLWNKWSSGSKTKYKPGECEAKWRSFAAGDGITIATLFDMAIKSGWRLLPYGPNHARPATGGKISESEPPKHTSHIEIIILPSNTGSTVTQSAHRIFSLIAPKHELFHRGGLVTKLVEDESKSLRLDVVRPEAFCSLLEKYGDLYAFRADPDKEEPCIKRCLCPKETAEKLLACEKTHLLPHIRGVASRPVLGNIAGKSRVLGRGYHRVNGGLLVASGDTPPDLPLATAVETLRLLVSDFDFATPGDRSRAMASFITPALRMGGWLSGHVPIDVAEADQSQSGKTYRQKLVFAIYGEEPARIARKDGGVGGLDESVSQALIAGRPFIQIDNVRGKLDSQFIEMVVTAGGSVGARVPHRGEVFVDARHFMFFITSNGVETTRDLANRSSIIRIRKRTGHAYRTFPEGDLLAHVQSRQPFFLGAVFRLIREWADAGRPSTVEKGHDFREWAGVLDWLVQHLLGEAPLIDGHNDAQNRASNPALTWLRQVALAVESDSRTSEELSASAIVELCAEHEIELPGLHRDDDESRQKRVGMLMKRAFGSGDSLSVDHITITRIQTERYDSTRQGQVPVKKYTFRPMPQIELEDLTNPPPAPAKHPPIQAYAATDNAISNMSSPSEFETLPRDPNLPF